MEDFTLFSGAVFGPRWKISFQMCSGVVLETMPAVCFICSVVMLSASTRCWRILCTGVSEAEEPAVCFFCSVVMLSASRRC